MIRLLELRLNHDTTASNADALNIRVNFAQGMTLPEWNAGPPANARPAAAYTFAAGATGPVILAKFERISPATKSVTIRAVANAPAANFLGTIPPTVIPFDGSDQTNLIPLAPRDVVLAAVGRHDDVWKWQYQTSTGTWLDFAQTVLRIYCVMDEPQSPWTQSLGDPTQLPWAEVLDYACDWASGETTTEGVARRVTEAVFDLGRNEILRYATKEGGPSFAEFEPYQFNCGLFLQTLNNPPAWPTRVNCIDCSSIISTFANALGCDLKQGTLGCSFRPNRILLIGLKKTTVFSVSFRYHELAWNGRQGEAARVWDCCLMVDGDADPGIGRFERLLPVNQRFRQSGSLAYRERIAVSADVGRCRLVGSAGNRRVGTNPSDPSVSGLCSALPVFKELHDKPRFQPFILTGKELPGWELLSQTPLDDAVSSRLIRSYWQTDSTGGAHLLELRLFVAETELSAAKRLWGWLEAFELETMKEEPRGPGEVRSANADHTVILFRRANVVVAARNDVQYDYAMDQVAADFDRFLLALGT